MDVYRHKCKLLTLSETHIAVQDSFKQRIHKRQPDSVTRQRQLWEAALPEEVLSAASTDSGSASSQVTDSSSSHSSQSDSSTSSSSQPTGSQPDGSHSSNSQTGNNQTGNSQGADVLPGSAGQQTGDFESHHAAKGKHAGGSKEEEELQEEEGEEEESFKRGPETGLGLHLTLGGDQEEEDGPEIEADGEEEYAEEEDPGAGAQMAGVDEDSSSRGDTSNKDWGEEDQQRFAGPREAAQQTPSAARKKVLQQLNCLRVMILLACIPNFSCAQNT